MLITVLIILAVVVAGVAVATKFGFVKDEDKNGVPDAVEEKNNGYLTIDYNQVHTFKISQLEQKIKELEFKIIDLENKLMMETMVKKSEVELNKELLERAEKHQLHIETLIKINEEYSNTISKLRLQLKNLIFNHVGR